MPTNRKKLVAPMRFQSEGLKPSTSDWKWKRARIVGIGGFSSVYLATREDNGLQFVVKSVPIATRDDFERKACEALQNEINLLERLQSKFIVKCLGHGVSTSSDFVSGQRETLDMHLEYLPKGNLTTFIKWHQKNKARPMLESWMATYTLDILRALEYLHKNEIVHGDIKGENVLFGSNCMKLVDFGSAKDCHVSKKSWVLEGTKGYMAPEVAHKVESTFASDIFSLGCTIIEMATDDYHGLLSSTRYFPGKPPFQMHKVKDCIRFIPKDISKEAQDFLQCCLKKNPKLRPCASQLLNHSFILNNFQSPHPWPRPKTSTIEFPYDCEYLDNRPSNDKSFKVHFVDKFQYSGPLSMVGQSADDLDSESQLDEECHGEKGECVERKYEDKKTLVATTQEIQTSRFNSRPMLANSKDVKNVHSTTKRPVEAYIQPSEDLQDKGNKCGISCCIGRAVDVME